VKSFVRLAALLLAAAAGAPAQDMPSLPRRADVFLAEYPGEARGGRFDAAVIRRMVDGMVMGATRQPDIASAWRVFVKQDDHVGIKVSASGAPVSSTHPAVIAAVAEGLVEAGVAPERIIIWDRKWDDLRRARYGALGRRYTVVSTDRVGGYDGEQFITAAAMGRLIAGDRAFDPDGAAEQTSSKSHISSVLRRVNKVIHIPALTDHLSSGINGALPSMVLDNVDNWRRLARAPHFGDPYLAEAYADPRIGGKVVLTILDALRPQYAGGPFPEPQYVLNHGALYASRDPVAIDAVGLPLLDLFRQEGGLPVLSKNIGWIQSAEAIGLGAASRERIRIIPVY
jgi:uncharacterized protein (DUF362 family)